MARKNAQGQSRSVADVLAVHGDELMSIPGVVGTGEGAREGKPCILVFVEQLNPGLQESIPSELKGFDVVIQEVGDVHAPPRER